MKILDPPLRNYNFIFDYTTINKINFNNALNSLPCFLQIFCFEYTMSVYFFQFVKMYL